MSTQTKTTLGVVIISILIAQAAGIVGSVFTAESVQTWYLTLNFPSWQPPSWVFGPVWVTLYALMGIAAALIWPHRKTTIGRQALVAYGIQLVLNTFWSILFFGQQNPELAFYEILVLLAAIITTIVLFWRIRRLAAVLMLPYLAWVTFATILNYTIWQLN